MYWDTEGGVCDGSCAVHAVVAACSTVRVCGCTGAGAHPVTCAATWAFARLWRTCICSGRLRTFLAWLSMHMYTPADTALQPSALATPRCMLATSSALQDMVWVLFIVTADAICHAGPGSGPSWLIPYPCKQHSASRPITASSGCQTPYTLTSEALICSFI